MTLPYKRKFGIGRQSEQFLNDELHQIHEALKRINYRKNENKGAEPDAIVDGALWFDKPDELLKYYDMRTLSWKTVFSKKFQITDQILNITMPSSPVPGQLWIYNGVLMYFDGSSWVPVKAMLQDESQWSNAAFEDFMIVTPLNPMPNAVVSGDTVDIDVNSFKAKPNDNHKDTNVAEPKNYKWGTDEWDEAIDANIKEPEKLAVPGDDIRSQFIVPNLNTDRIFLDTDLDDNYEEVSKVCFQYPTKDVYDKIVSCVHLNPGKLTKIIKRLIKIDKINSTINVSAYNTEFYGFKNGKYTGEFLVESNNQDSGDYIPSGDYIILNYSANQNYDYILAITYEFSTFKTAGGSDHWNSSNPTTSFYLANLKEPINVHGNGLKIEEASYDINYENKTVTIKDAAAEKVDIQMWSPYKKQFGYIRETDLEGNAIIKLSQRVAMPLVFVGGLLIHPLYGGLKFQDRKIIVPNHGGLDSMRNLAWCVVDLYSGGTEIMYSEKGLVEKAEREYKFCDEDYLDGNGNFIMHGNLQEGEDTPSAGIYDYILGCGTLSGENANVIFYNNKKITKDDGIILFINGFMINDKDIIRNQDEGFITVAPELVAGQEYLLLRDNDKRLYTEATMQAAFATGYLDESLVYVNGKLLANSSSITTTQNQADEGLISTNNEIKLFIDNEDKASWKIYDKYDYEWKDLTEEEIRNVELISSSYSNQLTSIKLNVETTDNDKVDVYSFRYSNTVSGVYKFGDAIFKGLDEDDNKQIYILGTDKYAYGQGVLNIFKNGKKLIPNIDYKELSENNFIKMLIEVNIENDRITYFIEPIESGETFGHEIVLLTNENSIQPNIYEIEDNDSTPDLYPGRLTVYINGLRIPKEDWTLLDNKKIMLKYSDYKTIGTANNYPDENILCGNKVISVHHNYPDHIMIEIRKDYDRKEATIILKPEDAQEIYLSKYPEITSDILESKDEVLFYLNGQFLNMSRSKSIDYKLDNYKGCVAIRNSQIVELLQTDPLKRILDRNSLAYASWKVRNNKEHYESNKKNVLTIVWR